VGKELRPSLVRTTTSRRVTFINRSAGSRGSVPRRRGDDRAFEVPVQLWVVFDRPGRHRYLVHLGTERDAVTLQGTVEVVKQGAGSLDPPTCDSVTLPG